MVVLEEVGYGGHSRPTEIAIAIGLKIGTLIVVSIAYTMILLEGVRSLMVISGYLEDKLNEKRRRDAARREAEEEQRKAEEEKRIAEIVETARAEAIETVRAEAFKTAIDSAIKYVGETHQAWADWNRRRIEADERGESFNEPPPEFPQNIGEPR